MKRIEEVMKVVLMIIVTAFLLWLMGSFLAAISTGPVDPGECEPQSGSC